MNLSREIFFLILLPISYLPNFADPIYLKPRAIISNPVVKLSDIARVPKSMSDKELFSTPEEPMILNSTDVKNLFPEQVDVLGSNVLIIPLVQKFDKEELVDSIKQELISKTNRSESEIRISYEGEEIFLPAKNVEFRWSSIAKDLTPGKKIFSLETWFKGNRIYSNRLKFSVEFKVKGLFTKKDLSRLTILKDSDIIQKEFYTLDNPTDIVLENIVGMTLLAPLREGDLIRKKHVRNLHTIERGSDVDLVYISDNILVKGRGTAKESGNTGQEIKVQSKSNGQIIKGIVNEKGWVQVE
ncbi:MAG: flagellar basal body P-ring formation chaperone FlgA [Leptospiraceae bacterium]|nr:flagellar basal body P-ring formation chaperone FlgA [Leptospiraceae bacterium]